MSQLANTVYGSFAGNGLKWLASEVLGSGIQPQVGNVWYVDGVAGLDTNSGSAYNDAFASLYAAHNAAQNNNYDVIIIASSGVGTGSGTNESSAVAGGAWTFSKNLITVIGSAAPSGISPRERILWDTALQSTTTVPLLTISGSGNSFVNFMFGTFVDNNVLVKVTGSRNYFAGVHFAGIGDATAGADTDAKSLWISGGQENYFSGCTIGLDTVARSTTNTEIQLDAQATRNRFEGCLILAYASSATHFFVKAETANAIDRFVSFNNCTFINPINSAATTMTDAMSISATVGGSIVITGTTSEIGATGWADNLTNVQALAISSNATYANGIGKPVNPGA